MKHVLFYMHVPLSDASLWPSLKICAALRNITAMVHAVAMEMATLKGCREAFVLLNGCKKWQNARGRHGMTVVQSGFDRVSCWGGYFFYPENGDKLLRTRFLFCFFVWLQKSRSFSWSQPGLTLLPNAAILDKFMKKQMVALGFLPGVFSLCCLQLKTWSCVHQWNPDHLSVPVNNCFVFLLWLKREQLLLFSCAFVSCYLRRGRGGLSEDCSREENRSLLWSLC